MVPDITAATFILIILNFVYLFIASGLLGLVFGLATALLLKASPSNHVHQVGLVSTPRWQHKPSGAAAVYLLQRCVALQPFKWACLGSLHLRPTVLQIAVTKSSCKSSSLLGWPTQAASLCADCQSPHAQTSLRCSPPCNPHPGRHMCLACCKGLPAA